MHEFDTLFRGAVVPRLTPLHSSLSDGSVSRIITLVCPFNIIYVVTRPPHNYHAQHLTMGHYVSENLFVSIVS